MNRAIESKIAAIAYASGFGDVSYFNRAFRRCYGQSPSEVRDEALAQRASDVD